MHGRTVTCNLKLMLMLMPMYLSFTENHVSSVQKFLAYAYAYAYAYGYTFIAWQQFIYQALGIVARICRFL